MGGFCWSLSCDSVNGDIGVIEREGEVNERDRGREEEFRG